MSTVHESNTFGSLLRHRKLHSANQAINQILRNRRLGKVRLTSLQLSQSPYRQFQPGQHHQSAILSLNLDQHQGRFLLSAGADAAVFVWDLLQAQEAGLGEELKPVAKLTRPQTHRYSISGCLWYPHDTGMFTTASMDHKLKVWDAVRLEEACAFDLQDRIYSHAFSPCAHSHSLIACGTADSKVRLCDLRSGSCAQMLLGHRDSVLAVQWSPQDDFLLATAGKDQTIQLWDIRGQNRSLVIFDENNSYSDMTVFEHKQRHRYDDSEKQGKVSLVMSVAEREKARAAVTSHGGPINGLQFTDDGLFLLSTGHDNRLRIWDVCEAQNMLVNFGMNIRNTHLHGIQMAMTSSLRDPWPPVVFHPNDNGIVIMYDTITGQELNSFRGHYGKVTTAVWNSFTDCLITAGHDSEILMWAPAEDERLFCGTSRSESDGAPELPVDQWSDDGF